MFVTILSRKCRSFIRITPISLFKSSISSSDDVKVFEGKTNFSCEEFDFRIIGRSCVINRPRYSKSDLNIHLITYYLVS
jgi:hypothetical protein